MAANAAVPFWLLTVASGEHYIRLMRVTAQASYLLFPVSWH